MSSLLQIFEPALQEKLICRRRSDTSNSSLPPAQVYTTVGIYKVNTEEKKFFQMGDPSKLFIY